MKSCSFDGEDCKDRMTASDLETQVYIRCEVERGKEDRRKQNKCDIREESCWDQRLVGGRHSVQPLQSDSDRSMKSNVVTSSIEEYQEKK